MAARELGAPRRPARPRRRRREAARRRAGPHLSAPLEPASFAQRRFWFLDGHQRNGTYNVPVLLRLHGPLDAAALRAALRRLVLRHAALRTTIALDEHGPMQRISAEPAFGYRALDVPPREAEAAIVEEAHRPFDLDRGPLFRALLLHGPADEHRLLLTLHQAITDARANDVLVDELCDLYADPAAHAGEPAATYADFARLQSAWMATGAPAARLAYWTAALRDAPDATALPFDLPRRAQRSARGRTLRFDLPERLLGAVKARAASEGAEPFDVLLASLYALLFRYGRDTDLVVGMASMNRWDARYEPVIGNFLNTLPVRVTLADGMTFRELVARARRARADAHDNDRLPFEALIDALSPGRDLSRLPLFNVFTSYRRVAPARRAGALTVEELPLATDTAQFDLTVNFEDFGDRGRADFEYDADLFEAGTVQRLGASWLQLLAGAAADPDAELLAVPMLGPRERAEAIAAGIAPPAPAASAPTVHGVFENAVRAHPHRHAAVSDGRTLTFAQLDAHANALAHRLREAGADTGVPVALSVARSPALVVAVLAVLKAGAAYVPLDPAYPPARLRAILAESGAQLLVSDGSFPAELAANMPRTVGTDDALAQTSPHPPASAAGPDTPAYVMYTSGSTGVPKGVAMTHRPLVNLLDWDARDRERDAARTLQFSSINFDASFVEMFSAWRQGGAIVLIDEERQRDPRLLWKTIVEQRIERAYLPYATLQVLATVFDPADAPRAALKAVVSCAEQFHPTPEIEAFVRVLGCSLRDQYGPSETHLVTSARLDGLGVAQRSGSIGRPIDGTSAYLLDERFEPVPIGATGELFLGGVALARGYFNRPGLTAERFIPDPFAAGARMYRTGDLGRFRGDGGLQYVGRADHQVKLRGFRIEPAEIERALMAHEHVTAAAVIMREDRPGDKRLVAYVAADEGVVDPVRLGAFVAERLPRYMVPAAFVMLPELPLNPNCKVDRHALARLKPAEPKTEERRARLPVESAVAAIVASGLGRASIGLDENIFDAGANSMLTPALSHRLRLALDVELPLRAFFQHPTVAELAAEVIARRCLAADPELLDRAAHDALGADHPPLAGAADVRALPPEARERLFALLGAGSQHEAPPHEDVTAPSLVTSPAG